MTRRKHTASTLFLCLLAGAALHLCAQTCTTQAAMQPVDRDALSTAALALGLAVKQDDVSAVKATTILAFANNFEAIEYAVRNTSGKLAGDTLRVTQIYELDASARKAGDPSEADFSCPLKSSAAETDFAIASLPPGQYAFAMVEAAGGDAPWLLAFLLQREAGAWKMAGFYPHARTAALHDGLWYWTAARERVKASQSWLAWLYFQEADMLLRPAAFASSTALDKLRLEQRSAAPPALSDGLSSTTPLVVKATGGQEFHFTSISSEAAPDNKSLYLVLHFAAEAIADPEASRARSRVAAKALLAAYPELRPAYSEVLVFADMPEQNPSTLTLRMDDIK